MKKNRHRTSFSTDLIFQTVVTRDDFLLHFVVSNVWRNSSFFFFFCQTTRSRSSGKTYNLITRVTFSIFISFSFFSAGRRKLQAALSLKLARTSASLKYFPQPSQLPLRRTLEQKLYQNPHRRCIQLKRQILHRWALQGTMNLNCSLSHKPNHCGVREFDESWH